ncbi:MAG: peptidase S46 [Bacteroidetes bacterium GWA2_31_9]|nr:MAG: peptidase S46 [Bacteroidetes bacterium GWA2_31_9]
MKKVLLIFVSISLLFNLSLIADEGMWLPLLIKSQIYDKMKAKGLNLTSEQIYDINNASLKDAIGGLGESSDPMGFYCTGEVISSEGLMLTNHHCGFESIQEHSSVEHDYLKDGFWAKSKQEELTNETMTVSFLVRMEEVTDKVLAELNDTMSEATRIAKIDEISRKIANDAASGTSYNTDVKSMFHNNKFYLLVYETFQDIRLVGAPPSSIGKFGGDTDNWMWPRHTGDFSIFRIYTGPDGKPAKYSKDNIPYKPKKHLPISLKGVKDGDFSMIYGFPGSTERYLTSYGVEQTLNISNPAAVRIRTKKLSIMKEFMNQSDKVRIQYASKYAETSNYWKYFIGQNKGLKRLKVYDQKTSLENKLQTWIEADSTRKSKYGEVLYQIEKSFSEDKKVALARQFVFEGMFQGSEIVMFPYQSFMLYNVLKNSPNSTDAINDEIAIIKDDAKNYFKDYDVNIDKKLLSELLKMYYNEVPKEYHFNIFNTVNKKFKGNFDKYAEYVFSKSIFADSTKFFSFLNNPNYKAIEKDPAFEITREVLILYFQFTADNAGTNDTLDQGMRLFVAALIEMQKDKQFYPDANATLRLTYGSVGKYRPADAVKFNYYTTIKGIIEKDNPNDDDFNVPQKLKDLYANKDYGQYGENGDLKVCFTTNNDITGGNSGSPVINGDGELIGTAFDGNWEAMSGDIAFENDLQKTIICDIRYVLFIVDKFAGATNLINELTIVK